MSFAFTFGPVGDIITVTQIVAQIISALNDSRGSAVEYQQLFAELRSLQRALDHLNKLSTRSGRDVKTLDSIKFAAAACRCPLEAFQRKIKKYHRLLGRDIVNSDGSDDGSTHSNVESSKKGKCQFISMKLASVPRKIQWEFTIKNEVQKLQNYLGAHVDVINNLLAVHGLETIMELNAAANEESHDKLKALINSTQRTMDYVSTNLDAQTLVVKNTSHTVEKLLGVVMEWNAPRKTLSDLASKICVSTQKIFRLLLEIKASTVDVRWLFFQEPVLVEDALGEKFPVPSEYDFSLLQGIILHRFQDGGQVSSMVCRGNYELSYARNSVHILSEGIRLMPGSHVIMAVILTQTEEIVTCPLPSCGSREYQTLQSGGFRCSICGVWFDKSTRTTIQETVEEDDERLEPNSRKRKNQHDVEPFCDTKRKRARHCSRHRLEDLRNIRLKQTLAVQGPVSRSLRESLSLDPHAEQERSISAASSRSSRIPSPELLERRLADFVTNLRSYQQQSWEETEKRQCPGPREPPGLGNQDSMSQRPPTSRPASRSPPDSPLDAQTIALPPVQVRNELQQGGRQVERQQPEQVNSRGHSHTLPSPQSVRTQASATGEDWRSRQLRDLGVHSILNPTEPQGTTPSSSRRVSIGNTESLLSVAGLASQLGASPTIGTPLPFPGHEVPSSTPLTQECPRATSPDDRGSPIPRRILTPRSLAARLATVE